MSRQDRSSIRGGDDKNGYLRLFGIARRNILRRKIDPKLPSGRPTIAPRQKNCSESGSAIFAAILLGLLKGYFGKNIFQMPGKFAEPDEGRFWSKMTLPPQKFSGSGSVIFAEILKGL